jgi:hypothetical protein
MQDPKSLKLYIAVLDEVPDHMVPVLVAHAVLGADQEFSWHDGVQGDWDYLQWKEHSFKKVVLRVNRKEFAKISALDNVYLGHENSTLGAEKSCAVVCPRYVIPNVLKFAKMWQPDPWTDVAHQQLLEVKRLEQIVAQMGQQIEKLEARVSDYSWESAARNHELQGSW